MMQKLGTSTVPTCQYEKKQLDSSCTYLRYVEALVIWRHHLKDLKHRERERCLPEHSLIIVSVYTAYSDMKIMKAYEGTAEWKEIIRSQQC